MILIIDGSYLGHIARFAFGSLDYETKHTGVIFGFLKQVLTLAREFRTNQFVFTWDSRQSHRRILYYPEYKQNRRKNLTDEELEKLHLAYEQFTLLRNYVIPSIGFENNFFQIGKESDDLIASIVYNIEGIDPSEIIVVSSDTDLYQLLDKCCLYSMKNRFVYKKDDFVKDYGINPLDWVQVKAIAGCSSDNVKGIKGIGEITAVKFLRSELNHKSKAWKDIVDPDNQGIIKNNFPIIRLPMEGTKPIKLYDFKDKLDLDGFMSVCNQYGFASFLRNISGWMENFF